MSSNTGPCEFCSRPGDVISSADENDLKENVYTCKSCLKLLKNPATALPLIRGHLSINNRNYGPTFKNDIEKFMGMLSSWKRNDKD